MYSIGSICKHSDVQTGMLCGLEVVNHGGPLAELG